MELEKKIIFSSLTFPELTNITLKVIININRVTFSQYALKQLNKLPFFIKEKLQYRISDIESLGLNDVSKRRRRIRIY